MTVEKQCCQFLEELSSQFGGKIRLQRKNPANFANFDWKALDLRNENVRVSYRELEEKTKLLRGLVPFRHFLCKIGQISAADLTDQSTFFRSLLYYAAEQQTVGNSFKKAGRITLLVHGCVGVSADGTWTVGGEEGCNCVRDNVTVELAS
jgi:hypothetical protein